jgi:hypothetical protein
VQLHLHEREKHSFSPCSPFSTVAVIDCSVSGSAANHNFCLLIFLSHWVKSYFYNNFKYKFNLVSLDYFNDINNTGNNTIKTVIYIFFNTLQYFIKLWSELQACLIGNPAHVAGDAAISSWKSGARCKSYK